jgi:hypothetical protein
VLLRLCCPVDDWTRLGSAIEAAGAATLAGILRAVLAAAPRSGGTAPVPVALAFTPQQAAALQQAAAGLGLDLPATPVAREPSPAGMVTTPAERAEAAAAAAAIVRGHQRLRVGPAGALGRPSRR